MKKVYLFIGLTLSLLAVGCNDDSTTDTPVAPAPEGEVVVSVAATLPDALVWSEGDLATINGKQAEAYPDAVDASKATFVVSDITSPVVLVAPSSAVSGLDKVILPAAQTYAGEGFDQSAYVLYGIGEFEPKAEGDESKEESVNLALAPVCGVVSIPVVLDPATASGEVALAKLSVTSLGEAPLSGTWTAAMSKNEETGEYAYTLTPSEVTATTDVRFETPAVLSTDAPVVINLVVPVGTYAGGFEVIATDSDNHNFIMTSTDDVVVEAGAAAAVSLPQLTFTVVEKAPATLNVTIAEGHSVVWAANDAVVVNNELSKNVVAESEVGGKSAQFSFDAVAYPYSVFYPAELYTTSGTVRFYSEQTISVNGLDRTSLAMAGYSNTTDVTLYSLCGIVTIPITNNYEGEDVIVEKIVVKSAMGDAICGKYHINYRTGKLAVVAPKSEITLTPTEEAPVTIGVGETVNIQFAVPAGFVNNGLLLDITASVGFKENIPVFPSGLDVRAGAENVAEAYSYEEVKIDAIRTADELLDFAKSVNAGRYKRFVNDNGEVVLGGDIDMSQLHGDWVPVKGLDGAGFDGVFNGQGFSIKNWFTQAPLFDRVALGATVQNLNIDASCELVSPEDYEPYSGVHAIGFIIGYNEGSIINCVNNADVVHNLDIGKDFTVCHASMVGNQVGGLMQNCINNGTVTLNIGKITKSVYAAGLAAQTKSSAVIDGCENHAKVTLNTDNAPTGNVYLSGVVGTNNSTEVKNCKNTADITVNAPGGGAMMSISGVTGYSSGPITDCYNEGAISFNTEGAIKGTSVAGIAPYSSGAVTGCVNKGDISVYCTSFAGTNNLGSITTSNATKAATCGAYGVLGYSYKADVANCENHGKITFHMTKAETSTSNDGRQGSAGIVGHPWGNVDNCKNFGDMDIRYASSTGDIFTDKAQCVMIGGIACADYFQKEQTLSCLNNCENHGNIYLLTHLNGSTNTLGGIIGWPGKEGAKDSGMFGCKNYGDVTAEGDSKLRMGGINGGSGNVRNCENHGTVTTSALNTGAVGGISGFHSNGLYNDGNKNFGDVVLAAKAKTNTAAVGVSGLIGNAGNSKNDGKINNNTVKCLVKSAVEGQNVGMLVGTHNSVASNAAIVKCGTADLPCYVAGTLNRAGAVTQITAETLTEDYMYGQTAANGADHTNHELNVVYYAE